MKRTGASNFRHVLAAFYGTPWAILPAKLAEIERALMLRVEGGSPALDELERIASARAARNGVAFDDSDMPSSEKPVRTDAGYKIVAGSAVISVSGVINPRASIFDEFSGGTSHEDISRQSDAAVADSKVESIIYDIDSPGGTVFGMYEGADRVRAATKAKPTLAVANYVAASAAYWYASVCGDVSVSPSGQVGCIGVIMRNVDETEQLKMMGVKDELISNSSSPYKTEGYPQVPITPELRADLLREADEIAKVFIADVAKGRGVRANKVEKDFGQGRMLMADAALAVGMVTRIETLQDAINRVNAARTRKAKRAISAQLVRSGLPTA